MTRYLLDTNVISELVRNPAGSVARRIEPVRNRCITSILVVAEIRYGVRKRGSTRLARLIQPILESIEIMGWDSPADDAYATLRCELEAAGTPIGSNDLLIAAHALALDCTLVSENEREFRHVPGLKVENWAA